MQQIEIYMAGCQFLKLFIKQPVEIRRILDEPDRQFGSQSDFFPVTFPERFTNNIFAVA